MIYAGRDATEEFNMLHDPKVWMTMMSSLERQLFSFHPFDDDLCRLSRDMRPTPSLERSRISDTSVAKDGVPQKPTFPFFLPLPFGFKHML